jgi:ferredoxin
MDPTLQHQTVFHLTGKRPAAGLDSADGLRPVLLARYRDLTRLRYDFPLVLVGGARGEFVRSLSAIVDDLLREIAPPGLDGEGLRRLVLGIERDIRRMVAAGAQNTLATLWEQAVAKLAPARGAAGLGELLAQAGAATHVDGALVDCDQQLPARLLTHAWRAAQERKARKARAEIDALIVRLTDILRADFLRSEAGQRPESLRASLGGSHQGLFDFEAMSRLLGHAPAPQRLPDARRGRIERALAALRAQRFFGTPSGATAPRIGDAPYEFAFRRGADAVAAFRQRLPAMVELVKAMSLAALEAEGRYAEATDDEFFDAFDEHALGARDLELFPDYLVCLDAGSGAAEQVTLMELLSSGIPVKVLAQVDDLFEDGGVGAGHFTFGVRSTQIASTAVGLTDCFVLQSASSNLFQVRGSVERGMSYPGPALFSVFSGAAARSGGLPPYLVAAAAMQSRAFPAFTYDPAAGPGLADRFSLEDNPQPGADWPVAPLEFADGELQRATEQVAFTFLDFVACDGRHMRHFARAPHAAWNGHMVPAAEWLAHPPPARGDKIPYLLAVDDRDVLQRVIADEQVVQAARRCRENWHRLQELGGVHSSHAERLLEREKSVWEAQKRKDIEAIRATATPAEPSAPGGAAISVPSEVQGEAAPAPIAVQRSRDEAYIETIRCSSCNECTQINDRMFAYNDNKQAFIKDLGAGSYRQLVEAAESCQLSIIHPGKPRDPNEPGLAELIERAQPFL